MAADAVPTAAAVTELLPKATELSFAATALAPMATALALLALLDRPTASASVACAVDWPPIAMALSAVDQAPRTLLAPMAMLPCWVADVESATDNGVVPSPPAEPIETAFAPVEMLPKPSATEPIADALLSTPLASAHFAAIASKPSAEAPDPVAWAKAPYTVTPV